MRWGVMIIPDEISHSCLMISMLFGEPEAPLLILFTKQHCVCAPPPRRRDKKVLFFVTRAQSKGAQ